MQKRYSLTVVSLLTIATAFIVYYLTAFRSIAWWDNAEYALAAVCLGVPHPPGSLLLILFGWVVSHLPLGISAIFLLNLFAGLLASLAVGIICSMARRSVSRAAVMSGSARWPYAVGAALAGLSLAFSNTLWTYALKFTPYILTALFTALILWAFSRWWEAVAIRKNEGYWWVLLMAILAGLDFSVHRTNLLLLPGLFVAMLIRDPVIFKRAKFWVYSVAGSVVGLAVHLLIIPLARQSPFLNVSNPDNLARFWDYVSLKQYGGSWLLSLFPRKAAFWQYQVMDFIGVLRDNFFTTDGPLGTLGILPGLLGLTGLVLLLWRRRGFALATLALYLVTAACTVIYFNIPEAFFRGFARHYFPTLVIFSVWIVAGGALLLSAVWKLRQPVKIPAVVVVALLIAVAAVSQLTRNYNRLDSSDNFIAHEMALNYLVPLPENAILISAGDTDTWPLWYLQVVEKVRPDVDVLNIHLLNTEWFINQVATNRVNVPLDYTEGEVAQLRAQKWPDSVITLAAPENATDSGQTPDSLYIQPPSTDENPFMLVQDKVLLRMLQENRWQRPVCFTSGVPSSLSWIRPYLRFEGLTYRLMPQQSPPIDRDSLRTILFERYNYRSITNPAVEIDVPTQWAANSLYAAFLTLAMEDFRAGDTAATAETIDGMYKLLPSERIPPPDNIAQAINYIRKAIEPESET